MGMDMGIVRVKPESALRHTYSLIISETVRPDGALEGRSTPTSLTWSLTLSRLVPRGSAIDDLRVEPKRFMRLACFASSSRVMW